MTLTFDWFLPTSGDGRTIVGRGHGLSLAGASGAQRAPDIDYLAQVLDVRRPVGGLRLG